jgi:hypothetical protein
MRHLARRRCMNEYGHVILPPQNADMLIFVIIRTCYAT